MNRQQRRLMKKHSQGGKHTPNLDTLILQADQFMDTGQFGLAEKVFRDILLQLPESAEVYNNLGHALENQKKVDEALACYLKAITLKADLAEAHFNAGNILCFKGRLDEAAKYYRQAITIKPSYARAYNSVGRILSEQGRSLEAISSFQQAIGLNPEFAEAYCNLGNAFFHQGQFNEASACYRRALELQSTMSDAHHGLGTIFGFQGKVADALKCYEKALAINPNVAQTQYNRILLGASAPNESDVEALKALANLDLPPSERIYLDFAFGKALESLRDYRGAFEHLLKGNALKRGQIQYDEARELREFSKIAEAFNPDIFERIHTVIESSVTPIFIVGMPRSGTTLIEQILASHPMVHGAGELETLRILTNNVRNKDGSILPYPEFVSQLDVSTCQKLGVSYLKSIPSTTEGKTFITDKMPNNFRFVGLIRLILPNAKIIHVMRDPMDTCVSCFSTLFAARQPFAYDLGELGRYYRSYNRLMDHWRSVLPPGSMFDISYEKLVGDFEAQVRSLLNYCGLAWDDRCLRFHETKRTVSTASAAQVRQPLYRKSVERWRRYEEFLAPLFTGLDISPSA